MPKKKVHVLISTLRGNGKKYHRWNDTIYVLIKFDSFGFTRILCTTPTSQLHVQQRHWHASTIQSSVWYWLCFCSNFSFILGHGPAHNLPLVASYGMLEGASGQLFLHGPLSRTQGNHSWGHSHHTEDRNHGHRNHNREYSHPTGKMTVKKKR